MTTAAAYRTRPTGNNEADRQTAVVSEAGLGGGNCRSSRRRPARLERRAAADHRRAAFDGASTLDLWAGLARALDAALGLAAVCLRQRIGA